MVLAYSLSLTLKLVVTSCETVILTSGTAVCREREREKNLNQFSDPNVSWLFRLLSLHARIHESLESPCYARQLISFALTWPMVGHK